jgi:hypothetical protein
MKIARPMRTEFGGTCAVPMADLTMESTIIILRKDVIEISRKGRRVMSARAIVICMLLLKLAEFNTLATSIPSFLGAA